MDGYERSVLLLFTSFFHEEISFGRYGWRLIHFFKIACMGMKEGASHGNPVVYRS